MKARSIVSSLLASAILAAPLAAHASSIADLEAQITSLLSQYAQLQAQLATLQITAIATSSVNAAVQLSASTTPLSTVPSITPTIAAAPACPLFSRPLTLGSRGSDVASLQAYLAASGLLSADSATGYFGALTLTALKNWQSQNGVVVSGTAATTGWGVAGPKTQAAIAAACGGAPLPNNDTLEVSSTALEVQAHVIVNVRSSCSAFAYTLDWGDGSPKETIAIAGNSCAPVSKTLSHAYAVAGTYTILLSSSFSTIRAPISVKAAPSACVQPYIIVSALPPGTVGTLWSAPIFSGSTSASLSALGLPAGFSIVHTNQVESPSGATSTVWSVQGTPTVAGAYTVVLTAQNTCGSNQVTLPLTISSSTTVSTPVTPSVSTPSACTTLNCAVGYHASGPSCSAAQTCVADTPTACTILDCAAGYHASGPSCSANQTCVPDATPLSCTVVDCAYGYHASGPACSASQTCILN